MFIWDFVANPVMDALVDWFYSQVVGFLGAFFAQMGNMGVELFELEWVQAVVQFFSQLGWALYGISLVVAGFECGIEYASGGRGNFQQVALNAIKGFLAVSLFIRHLEAIQSASASSREFLLVVRLEEKEAADERGLRQLEKALCDHGVRVQLVEEQDVKRLLAVYYQHDVTTDYFEDVDGERAVTGNG